MIFKKCSVRGRSFGDPATPSEKKEITFVERERVSLVAAMRNTQDEFHEEAREFVTIMAVCHTVMVDLQFGQLKYSGASPDELALVEGANSLGIELIARNSHEIIVHDHFDSADKVYRIVAEFPFDSTRKRMSLLVEINGEYILMTKGADSAMNPKLEYQPESRAAKLKWSAKNDI